MNIPHQPENTIPNMKCARNLMLRGYFLQQGKGSLSKKIQRWFVLKENLQEAAKVFKNMLSFLFVILQYFVYNANFQRVLEVL